MGVPPSHLCMYASECLAYQLTTLVSKCSSSTHFVHFFLKRGRKHEARRQNLDDGSDVPTRRLPDLSGFKQLLNLPVADQVSVNVGIHCLH